MNKKVSNKKKRMLVVFITLALLLTTLSLVTVYFIKEVDNKEEKLEPINEKFTFLIDEEGTSLKNNDTISDQYAMYQKILDEYHNNKYSIEKPLIKVDPFNCSPLTALVLFKTKKSEGIRVTIKGKHNDDITRIFKSSKDHIIPIYGLYGKYDNEVILESDSGLSSTINIKIEKEFPKVKVDILTNEIKNSNGEFYFGTSSLGASTIAYDNYGEIRWGLNTGYTKGMTALQNGHLLLSNDKLGPDVTSTGGIVEIDMLGYIYHEYELEGGYHHDAYELENGNLLVLTTNPNNNTFADYIIEIDKTNGNIIKSWNLKDIVSKVDPNLIKENQITWGWINSIAYDKKTDSLIISVRNQNAIMSIGYTSNNINWILGNKTYWSSKFEPYFIKGNNDEFIYPMGPHSVSVLNDGSISIFNNGYDSYEEEEVPCKSLINNESYAMIYKIDTNTKIASITYKFGGKEYFSYALSSYTYATNNHKIFNSGWHFTDKVDYNNEMCTQFSNDLYDSYIIDFDENNKPVVKLHIDESKFEVLKSDIYNFASISVIPKNIGIIDNYAVKNGKYTSTYPKDEFEILTEEEALKYQTNETNYITFNLYNNRLKLLGSIPNNMEFKVTLISTTGTAYRYTMKSKNTTTKEFIDLSNLPKGRYYIYVNLDEYIYNTTQYIDFK